VPCLFLLLSITSALFAQQQTPPAEQTPVFRASITLVKVDVKATAGAGRNLTDLKREDFVVFDENEPQKISHFGHEFEPLDVLLLLDVSGSMWRSLGEMAATTHAALSQLHEGARVAVMEFAQRAQVMQPFTDDFRSVQTRILDTIYKQTLGRGTLINESLVSAAQYVKTEGATGRRAILIVTDNEGSQYQVKDQDVIRAMDAADAVLYALVVREGGRPEAPGRYSNPDIASGTDVFKLAQRTGGEVIDAGNISETFKNIIERIRSRYSLQYPAPAGEAGSFRHIRVELAPAARRKYPDAVIKARTGYYVAP
jgi:VWFA-related protein